MNGTWDRTVRTAPSPARLAEEARIRALYENMVIPNVGGPSRITNAPVGATLGWPQRRGPGTAPSNARMAELERIARLYGYLPAIDQGFLAGLGGAPTPTAPMPPPQTDRLAGLPPEWQTVLTAPVPQPIVGNAIPSPAGSSEPVISPSSEPTGAVPPQARANAAPQNAGEQNFWDRLLTRRQGTPEELARLGARGNADPVPYSVPGSDFPTYMQTRDQADGQAARRAGEDALLEQQVMDAAARRPTARDPAAPPPAPVQAQPPSEAAPPQGPNAPPSAGGAVPSGAGRYGRFEGRDPDFSRVMEAYERGRPMTRERDPEERTLRLVAAALGGMQGRTGVDVASGAVAGLGAGYARESDRDETIWQRDEDARRQFELGLAGLLGQQEQAQFNNALARQGFDRTSMMAEDADARAREGLALTRENAGDARLLTRLRIASLARNLGMEQEPAMILSRGVQALADAPAAQIIVDGRPMTLSVGGQQLTLGQVRDRLLADRGQARNFAANPLFAGNPTMVNRQIDADFGAMFMEGFARMTPEQQRQVLMQLGRLSESRPRAGTTRVGEE